jgi:RNA polymerase primary sigma factor
VFLPSPRRPPPRTTGNLQPGFRTLDDGRPGKVSLVRKPAARARAIARELASRARKAGVLPESRLDEYLDARTGFDDRVDALIDALGDVPLGGAEALPSEDPLTARNERPRIPPAVDDDSLRSYLRQVRPLKRQERAEEVRLAKRYEFARRRFAAAVVAARVRIDHLRSVLGREYSRGFARDFRPGASGARADAAALADSRRDTLRARAAEMNRPRAEFVERNLGVVADLALCYRTYGVPLMDLIQEGNGALIRAVEKFDWRKEVRFQTYATFWIRQAVERSIAFSRGIVRVPNYLQQKMRRLRREGVLPRRDRDVSVREVSVAFDVKREVAGHLLETERTHYSLDVPVGEDGQTFASLLPDGAEGNGPASNELKLLRARIGEVLGDLLPLEREILELRYGLQGGNPCTLEEVGRRMNVSRERIRQLQVRAIRKLQRPPLCRRLSGFV